MKLIGERDVINIKLAFTDPFTKEQSDAEIRNILKCFFKIDKKITKR